MEAGESTRIDESDRSGCRACVDAGAAWHASRHASAAPGAGESGSAAGGSAAGSTRASNTHSTAGARIGSE